MFSDRELLEKDLLVLETLVNHLDAYLSSPDTHWLINEPEMPKLTLGGCLMRQQRLQQLSHLLLPVDKNWLAASTAPLHQALQHSIVRVETKAHQEMHARLGEWVHYLTELSRHRQTAPTHYANIVDTRVVISVLMTQMQLSPFRLQPQIVTEVTALDHNLHGRWTPGEFVWPSLWQPVYDRELYWYLYGSTELAEVG